MRVQCPPGDDGSHDPMDFTPYYVNIAIYSLFNLVFGLYSHLIKEQLFLSETLVAVLFGVAFGPRGLNLIFPARNQSSFSLWILFYQFARLVMAFQTMAAGISLPKYKCGCAVLSGCILRIFACP